MARNVRRLAAAFALAAICLTPTSALAGNRMTDIESSKASPAFDLLIIRPLGLAGLVVSAGLWVPAQAITMAVAPREWEKPIDLMLKKPANFVFRDPIGSH